MRQVSWGEALVVAAFREPRGLAGAVERIHAAVGDFIGTRNTFAKLLRVSDPSGLDARDEFRAWLLISAFGEDPVTWGIPDSVVPPSMDPERLRIDLRPRHDSNVQPTGLSAGVDDDVTGGHLATVHPLTPRPRIRHLAGTASAVVIPLRRRPA